MAVQNPRTKRVEVRFTAEEKEALRRRAESAGVDMSDLIRGAVLGTSDPGIAAAQAGPRDRATVTLSGLTTEPPSEPAAKISNVTGSQSPRPSTGPPADWLAQRIRVLKPEHGPKAEAVARKEWRAL